MIKKTILSKVICATILFSPLLMTSCETISSLFGESSRYSYPESYGHKRMEPNQRTVVPSNQPTSTKSGAATSTSRHVKHSPAAVPLEAPTVHRSSHSTSSTSNTSSNSSESSSAGLKSTSQQDAIPTTTNVPSVPTTSSTTTVTPATGMAVPTVGQ